VTSAIRAQAEGTVEVDVQVVPRASRSRVVGVHGERVKVQLAAPPVDGAANDELVALLAEVLGVPRRAVTIVRGHSSKRKTVRIEGTDGDAVRRTLEVAP
jgi:hypothetical protein